MEAVRQAIAAANTHFGACVAAKDFKGLAACYTADATLLPPGSPSVKGQAAIGPFWQAAAASLGLQSAVLTTRDLEVTGDQANEIGEAVLQLSSGPARIKYLVVWKRQSGGSWKMHWDMWNDLPAA
jgi:ketosteroid isomerase-like protein